MSETQETPQKIEHGAYLEIGKEQKPNFKEFYPVNEPFGYVGISIEKETGKLRYLTVEPTMTHARAVGADAWIGFLVLTHPGGTNIDFPDATNESSVTNPAWVRLDAAEEYPLEAESAMGAAETFILHRVVGSVVGQKMIVQEAL